MSGVYLKRQLRFVSCAVAGRPGRSAYQSAVDGGYAGSPEDFAAALAALPGLLERTAALEERVAALEAAQ